MGLRVTVIRGLSCLGVLRSIKHLHILYQNDDAILPLSEAFISSIKFSEQTHFFETI